MATFTTRNFTFQPYEYTSLPPSSIRLLSLVDDNDHPLNATICGIRLMQCTMTAVDLDENPVYDALSYTWGSPVLRPLNPSVYAPTSRWPIVVNGKLLYITKNLYDALYELKSEPLRVHTRYEPFNKTELIRASEEGRTIDVQTQLQRGATVNAKDRFDQTGLHYAAENGHLTIVKMLLQSGSDPTLTDSKGRTPLACCLQRKLGEWMSVAKVLSNPVAVAIGLPKHSNKIQLSRRSIWIDAVCINQNDIPERNAQVSMMARVYSSAHQVIIWLGPKDEYTDKALDRISCKVEDTDHERGYASCGLSDIHAQARNTQFSESDDAALHRLIQRTWFSRVWMIQELALAKSIKILCGSRQFDWSHLFAYVLRFLGASDHSGSTKPISHTNVKLHTGPAMRPCILADARIRGRIDAPERQHLRHMTECFQRSIHPSLTTHLSLPVLLAITRDFEATDPRDKIFALFSIARLPGYHNFTADYSRSVVDVYTEFGRIFVEAPGNNDFQDCNTGEIEGLEPLEGLSFIQDPSFEEPHPECPSCAQVRWTSVKRTSMERTPGLPSWVPDFKNGLATPLMFRKSFEASAQSQYVAYQSSDRILRLDGGFLDVIAETDVNKPTWLRMTRLMDCRCWLDIISKLDVTYPTGINRAEALWRTLLLDEDRHDSSTAKSCFRKWLCFELYYIRKELGGNAADMEKLQFLAAADYTNSLLTVSDVEAFDAESSQEIQNTAESLGSRFLYYYRMRRLLRTKKGFLGLGPRSALAGDQVWILSGARTPFVLRDASVEHGPDSFQMIGEAYVHGVMHGEAVAAEDFQFRPINLV